MTPEEPAEKIEHKLALRAHYGEGVRKVIADLIRQHTQPSGSARAAAVEFLESLGVTWTPEIEDRLVKIIARHCDVGELMPKIYGVIEKLQDEYLDEREDHYQQKVGLLEIVKRDIRAAVQAAREGE